MLERGYIKNLNKFKTKLNLDNSRPSFLEDQDTEFSSKFNKSSNLIDRPKIQVRSPKIFDLDQIKKQLGLIELRNSKSQHNVNVNKNFIQQPQFLHESSSFKKHKNDSTNSTSKLNIKQKETQPVSIKNPHKQEKIINPHKQQKIIEEEDEKTGFTERITQLVRMRQQHEKIINNLVSKKTSIVSTDEETINGFRRRNPQLQNKYIRVVQTYQVNKKQRLGEPQTKPERLSFKKEPFKSNQYQENDKKSLGFQKQVLRFQEQQKNLQNAPKKRTAEQMYKDIQSKLGTPKKNQSKQKVYKTYSSSGNEESNQNISESVIEESVSERQIIQAKPQDMSNLGFEVPESIQESHQYIEQSQLNESTFEMQQHVNLIASLSQFQFKHSSDQFLKEVSLQSQLHYSIQTYLHENLRKGNKNPPLDSVRQVEIKYICMENGYQNTSTIQKTVKKVKDLNGNFVQIVDFLCINEAWQGLFVCEPIQYESKGNASSKSTEISTLMEYRGLNFDNGSYSQVTLSNKPLQESQKKMIIFTFAQAGKTLICDITLVLLSRLIDLNLNKKFPQMLNRLFGYQFKTFKISQLNDFLECLDFIDRLREIHNKQLKNQGGLIVEDKLNQSLREKYSMKYIEYPEDSQNDEANEESKYLQDSEKHCDFFIYGHSKTSQSYELVRPCFFSDKNKTQAPIKLYQFRELMRHEKYMKKLADTYDYLTVTNNKELPVKSIKLKHFDNHFVVVSVNVVEEGLYFMSVGNEAAESNGSENLKYRICLISSSTKTILQCLILQRNESYPVYLPKQEFEVFISAYESCSDLSTKLSQKDQQSHSHSGIINFTFYIQSQHISGKNELINVQMMESKELEFELRLKEEYKNYTSMVLEQFIEFSFLDKEITKFFIQMDPELSGNYCIQRHPTDQSQSINLNQSQTVEEQTQQPSVPEKSRLDSEFRSTVKSFKFPDAQNSLSKIQKFSSKPSQSSEHENPNIHKKSVSILQAEKEAKASKSNCQLDDTTFTFQQISLQEKTNHQLIILRVHLKALDLFIDCINTTSLRDLSSLNQNQFEFKIKYSQERVLCDLNHHKNTVLLRSNTINLIYLSKDSPIDEITKQNEFCQKTYSNQTISHKIFRKQW